MVENEHNKSGTIYVFWYQDVNYLSIDLELGNFKDENGYRTVNWMYNKIEAPLLEVEE